MNMDCPGHVASDSLGRPGDIKKNRPCMGHYCVMQ